MQLNEILEENSIKSISQKTKISEENLENLLARNFEVLMKIKTLGFISILEREYKADLNALREEALAYYADHREDHSFSVGVPMEDEKKGTIDWTDIITHLRIAHHLQQDSELTKSLAFAL